MCVCVLVCFQESGRRYLQFTVPRVVPVAPQMRLIEDNTSNISLTDIFKQVYACSGSHSELDTMGGTCRLEDPQ